MRIYNNSEDKQDYFIINISKLKETSSKAIKVVNQLPPQAMESESERKSDIVEISNDARSLYEEMERIRENGEASGKAIEDLGKIMEIARRISQGDRVPSKDEKKLMEYNSKLYQAAKTAALLKANKKQKEHESLWKDEENSNNDKIGDSDVVTVDTVVNNAINTVESVEASIEVDGEL